MQNNLILNIFIVMAFIAFLMPVYDVMAVFSDAVELAPSSTGTTISVDLNPDSLFQKLRDFVAIDIKITPKSIVSGDMFSGAFSGWNDSIRDITGVDLMKFFSFVSGLFYKVYIWVAGLI